MKILFVTEWFNPEPTFKGLSFARELQKRGHEVEVLTGFPSYPGGKVYPGYKIRFYQREVMDGVPLIRIPIYPSHDTSAIRRIATYLSYALSAAFLGIWLVRRADIVYIYNPPATVTFPGLLIRVFKARRTVYDIQDMWPDTLEATGMVRYRWMITLMGWYCHLSYRLLDRIVVLSQGFRQMLLERGVPDSKIDVIRNWADAAAEEHYPRDPELQRRLGFEGRFTILFAGQMGKAQHLDAALEAARLVAQKDPCIDFAFIGGGIERERLIARSRELGLSNVRFLERVPITEIGKVLALADVLLVHLKDDPLFRVTIPSKTQGYLAAGRPILMAVAGEAATIVREAEAGLTCPPDDPQAMAEAALTLKALRPEEREALGRRGRAYYDRNLSLSVGVSHFEKIFEKTLGHP